MQEILLKIDNKQIENKLSQKRNKNIEQIIIDIVSDYEDKEIDDVDFTKKYKKLDPKEHIKRFEFIDDSNEEMTNPFENIEDVAKFSKELREKS
ncbi:MAG: hypothetical protein A2086_15075 [Spirochaetes bacterium GWD1_27_9]|nr:MAG: hypothetical protein A2Z98_17090 [Spirochaetes bacterium GWB1_27_13]OHD31086.1 MAG: hypothetical protein A2086_15075 [Spirochaetes bacterium GWD1_27_9]